MPGQIFYSLPEELPDYNELGGIVDNLIQEDREELAREALEVMYKACEIGDLMSLADFLLDWEATAEIEAGRDIQDPIFSARKSRARNSVSLKQAPSR